MEKKVEENPYGLSPEEMKVVYHWQNGMSMTDAYKHVMLSLYDQQAIKQSALNKRVQRFFNTYRIRAAMAAVPGERGEKARQDFDKWQTQQKLDAAKTFSSFVKKKDKNEIESQVNVGIQSEKELSEDAIQRAAEESRREIEISRIDAENRAVLGDVSPLKKERKGGADAATRFFDKIVKPNLSSAIKETGTVNNREQWVRTVSNYGNDPTALSVYGTGQFLIYVAVKEIMDRREAIAKGGISVLEKDGRGSALTPNIISALKTGSAMVLPFAPAPTADQRQSMQNIAALFSAIPDIKEDPDAYTAPPPNTIDIEADNGGDSNN